MSNTTNKSLTDYTYTSDADIEKLWKLLTVKKAPCIPPSLQGFYTAKICETRGASPRKYDDIILEKAEKFTDDELAFFNKITDLMWHEISDGLPNCHFHPICIADKKKGPLVEEWIVGLNRAVQTSPEPWGKLSSHPEYGRLFFYILLIMDNEKPSGERMFPAPVGFEEDWQKRYEEIYASVQTGLPIIVRQFYKYFQGEPFEMDDLDIILKHKEAPTKWS